MFCSVLRVTTSAQCICNGNTRSNNSTSTGPGVDGVNVTLPPVSSPLPGPPVPPAQAGDCDDGQGFGECKGASDCDDGSGSSNLCCVSTLCVCVTPAAGEAFLCVPDQYFINWSSGIGNWSANWMHIFISSKHSVLRFDSIAFLFNAPPSLIPSTISVSILHFGLLSYCPIHKICHFVGIPGTFVCVELWLHPYSEYCAVFDEPSKDLIILVHM